MKNFDLNNIDIDKLVGDRNMFNEFVYTPLIEALDEIKRRWADKELEKRISKYLNGDVPEPLVSNFKAVLFRQLFSPNYEFLHFMKILRDIDIKPMFLEYYDDKFTSNNPIKRSLGKLKFQQLSAENNKNRIECRNIIEFNKSDGKKFSEIQTIWDHQSLIDFHHELLETISPGSCNYLYDCSEWFHRGGESASAYYSRYISLFIRNGILFENFILNGNELAFVKHIFLPAFINAWKISGKKPNIVLLLPLSSQEEAFWLSYKPEVLNFIRKKKSSMSKL